MTNLLVRLFTNDSGNPESTAVRGQYGRLSGIVGICINLFLFISKLTIGLISRSIAISADAVNNLSDASSSIVTLVGFKLSEKPADEGHPFGHARSEYISGLIVAITIIVIGIELARSSFDKIMNPEQVVIGFWTVFVLVLSILIKLWLSVFNRTIGKRIGSMALIATSVDSSNDCISTSVVLISAVIGHFSSLAIDGYTGILVALFVIYSGVKTAKETIDPIIGSAPDRELIESLKSKVLGFDKMILGIHDLYVHDYGPGRRFASMHVEIDKSIDPLDAHDVIDNIEKAFKLENNIQLVIHYDPVTTDDEELNHMKALVSDKIALIDPRFSLHDFRMVRGTDHTNLIFDVVIPFDCASREDEIKRELTKTVQFDDMKYYTVITFDIGT